MHFKQKSASGDSNFEEFSVEQMANLLDKTHFATTPKHQHNNVKFKPLIYIKLNSS